MIRDSFERLSSYYGAQDWWPAEHSFEIMIGALLVQRTTWHNAARAVARLRQAGLLDITALAAADEESLRELVRPAGFYRSKARRLVGLARFVARTGGVSSLRCLATPDLRSHLLRLEGIGSETADAILLYAFGRSVCVVDAYLRRWHGRMCGEEFDDDSLRRRVMAELPAAAQLNEFHALVVEHGKRQCRTRPRCGDCCLREGCAHGRS